MPISQTIFVIKSGSLYGAGNNGDGQLGLGDTSDRSSLTKITIPDSKTPKYIASGDYHTLVLMTDRSLYATGRNSHGGLGLGDTVNRSLLTKITIPDSKTPKYIACGNHTAVLMTDGSLYATGYNYYGELGLGNTVNRSLLTQVLNTTSKKPKYIASGAGHIVVLMSDGSLYGTGYNWSGQLGLGNAAENRSLLTPFLTTPGKTPKYIACGANHTYVLMTDGSLYGAGYNQFGQLGLGASDTDRSSLTSITIPDSKTPKYIACGGFHSVVLMTDGSLYGTGMNGSGQLTGTSTADIRLLTKITIPDSKTPKYIACANSNTAVLMTDGYLYVTGENYRGQSGLGVTTRAKVLTSVSDGVSYIADMMDYVDLYKHNYTAYFMKSY